MYSLPRRGYARMCRGRLSSGRSSLALGTTTARDLGIRSRKTRNRPVHLRQTRVRLDDDPRSSSRPANRAAGVPCNPAASCMIRSRFRGHRGPFGRWRLSGNVTGERTPCDSFLMGCPNNDRRPNGFLARGASAGSCSSLTTRFCRPLALGRLGDIRTRRCVASPLILSFINGVPATEDTVTAEAADDVDAL